MLHEQAHISKPHLRILCPEEEFRTSKDSREKGKIESNSGINRSLSPRTKGTQCMYVGRQCLGWAKRICRVGVSKGYLDVPAVHCSTVMNLLALYLYR